MNEKPILLDEKEPVLGPFLCRPGTDTMSFWICTPTDRENVIVTIQGLQSVPLKLMESEGFELPMKIWIGTATGLTPNTLYEYSASIDGHALEFPEHKADDFSFRTLRAGASGDEDRFILMSCHGVDDYQTAYEKDQHKEKKLKPVFNMWENLHSVIKSKSDIRFGFMAGDQVYMDKPFGDYLTNPSITWDSTKIQKDSFDTYHRFWKDINYRKCLARIPFFLNWDDHDLIDGWGSRDEQFEDKLKEKWLDYFSVQKEIARLMQFSRNPNDPAKDANSFYFKFEHGTSLFSIFDLRSGRNKTEALMLSKDQKNSFAQDIGASSADDHFIVSSVTMARMSGKIEKGIGNISNFIWDFSAYLGYGPNLKKILSWTIFSFAILLPRSSSYQFFHIDLGALAILLAPLYLYVRLRTKVEKPFGPTLKRKLKIVLLATGFLGWVLNLIYNILCPTPLNYLNENFNFDSMQLNYIFSILLINLLLGMLALGFTQETILKLNGFLRDKNAEKLAQALIPIISRKISTKSALCTSTIFNVVYFSISKPNMFFLTNIILSILAFVALLMISLEATGAIDEVAGLDDDIEDSWSSETNKEEFQMFVNVMRTTTKRSTVLSGDIHTAGISQMIIEPNGKRMRLPQIVSSPITYTIMAPLVEKLTSSPGYQKVTDDLGVYNLFYQSQRNYCVIDKANGTINVDFHFEDLEQPMRIENVHGI